MPRRPGDIAACYADPTLARELLGWTAQHDLARMCEDSWRWQSMNPKGFTS
jgi:UDP-glucose 4-epimerase